MSTEAIEQGYVPSKLDKQKTFIWWTYDVIAVTLIPFYFLVLLLKMPIIGISVALSLGWLFNKFKAASHPQFLKHIWYWHLSGLLRRKTKSLPQSHIRKFIG